MAVLVNPLIGVQVEVTDEKAGRLPGFIPVDQLPQAPEPEVKAPAKRTRRASEKN